jgi:hypothetical protein
METEKEIKEREKKVIIFNKQQIWQQIFHFTYGTNAHMKNKNYPLHSSKYTKTCNFNRGGPKLKFVDTFCCTNRTRMFAFTCLFH